MYVCVCLNVFMFVYMYVSSVCMYDIMYILKYQEEVGYIDVFLYVCVCFGT